MNDTVLDRAAGTFKLELTAPQLKITHTALRSLLLDFGHDEREVAGIVRDVLAKLPTEEDIRAIDISEELARRRPRGAAR